MACSRYIQASTNLSPNSLVPSIRLVKGRVCCSSQLVQCETQASLYMVLDSHRQVTTEAMPCTFITTSPSEELFNVSLPLY